MRFSPIIVTDGRRHCQRRRRSRTARAAAARTPPHAVSRHSDPEFSDKSRPPLPSGFLSGLDERQKFT